MTVTSHVRRVSATGALLAVAGVLAAGCGAVSSSTSAAGSPASGSSPAAGSTGTSAGTSAPGATAPGTSAPATGSAAPATPSPAGPTGNPDGSPACTTADLKTTIGDGSGGAAGSFYHVIDFTNISAAPCTLQGYPGVSLRDARSAQIGAAATRTLTPGPSVVKLAPGATANATLKLEDAENFPASQCHPVTSAFLLVYPPNQTQSVKIALNEETCASSAVKVLAVSAVTSGS
ncbi:MAG TPA: DUF4232 domain-containing protein [Trebonia sp.]|nr:DUF4232 domain-containing protein [Trebonia sp.]